MPRGHHGLANGGFPYHSVWKLSLTTHSHSALIGTTSSHQRSHASSIQPRFVRCCNIEACYKPTKRNCESRGPKFNAPPVPGLEPLANDGIRRQTVCASKTSIDRAWETTTICGPWEDTTKLETISTSVDRNKCQAVASK